MITITIHTKINNSYHDRRDQYNNRHDNYNDQMITEKINRGQYRNDGRVHEYQFQTKKHVETIIYVL